MNFLEMMDMYIAQIVLMYIYLKSHQAMYNKYVNYNSIMWLYVKKKRVDGEEPDLYHGQGHWDMFIIHVK